MLVHQTPDSATLYLGNEPATELHAELLETLQELMSSSNRYVDVDLRYVDHLNQPDLDALADFASRMSNMDCTLTLVGASSDLQQSLLQLGFDIGLNSDLFCKEGPPVNLTLPWATYNLVAPEI